MGQSLSFGLTQFEVEELVAYTNGAFTQAEVAALYKRFRSLDRGRKGFITAEEFLSIPELSINPLAKRLAYFFDSINFRDFLAMLAPYSPNANKQDKVKHMFQIIDVDGDGIISEEDLSLILRQLAGSSLTDGDIKVLAEKTMQTAGSKKHGLTFKDYAHAMKDVPIELHVEIPVETV